MPAYVHGSGPNARRVASFAGRDGSHLFATIRWPPIALASGEHNHSIGATMIAGSSIARRAFAGAVAGSTEHFAENPQHFDCRNDADKLSTVHEWQPADLMLD